MSFLLQSPGMAHQACLSNSSHSHSHNVKARLQDGKRRACQGLLDCVCASQVAGRTCPVGPRLLVASGDWPLRPPLSPQAALSGSLSLCDDGAVPLQSQEHDGALWVPASSASLNLNELLCCICIEWIQQRPSLILYPHPEPEPITYLDLRCRQPCLSWQRAWEVERPGGSVPLGPMVLWWAPWGASCLFDHPSPHALTAWL